MHMQAPHQLLSYLVLHLLPLSLIPLLPPTATTIQTSPSTTDTAPSNRSVNLLSSSSYKDDIGYLHVIGEVQNTLPDAQKFNKFLIALTSNHRLVVD
jgi:hypothetical protein